MNSEIEKLKYLREKQRLKSKLDKLYSKKMTYIKDQKFDDAARTRDEERQLIEEHKNIFQEEFKQLENIRYKRKIKDEFSNIVDDALSKQLPLSQIKLLLNEEFRGILDKILDI